MVVDANGTLLLTGGGEFTDQAKAIVGGTGAGLLTLMGGALALTGSTADALVIGEAAGSNGTIVNLEQITANGTVVVGESGSGTLALLGVASSMTAGGATIGRSAGGQGTVLVNGGFWAIGQSTGQLTSSGELIVGDAGNGSLLIDGAANGISGQVTAYDATIGKQTGSQGSVRLDGGLLLVANAYATDHSTLTVGDDGAGRLEIEHGSEVAVGAASAGNNGLLIVGRADDGRGRIRIGDYSALLVYGDAHLGEAGAAEVTVGAGADHDALFGVNGTLVLGPAGSPRLGWYRRHRPRGDLPHCFGRQRLRLGHAFGPGRRQQDRAARRHPQRRLDHGERRRAAALRRRLGLGRPVHGRWIVTHAAGSCRDGADTDLRRQRTCPAQRSARLPGHDHRLQWR